MSDFLLLVLAGDIRECRAFLAGVAAGRKLPWRIHFAEECDVHTESLAHRLLERLHLDQDLTHVLVAGEIVGAVREALHGVAPEAHVPIALRAEHPILEARLPYRFHAFSHQTAGTIHKALADLPAGVRLVDSKEEARVDPEAKGIEIYAPTHEYELKGEGAIVGGCGEILAVRERFAAIEMIETEPILLSLGDAVPGVG
ncbi:MAG: hypothetical protein V1774_05930 [Candidatus Eisenbacteria bacterium]